MKQILYIFSFLFLISFTNAQTEKPPKTSDFYLSVGYQNMGATTFGNYFDTIIEGFNYYGVPLQKQVNFGNTLIAKTGIIFNVLKKVGFGFSFNYSFSPAYSNYKDVTGTAKLKGKFNGYGLSATVKYKLYEISEFPVYLMADFGVVYSTLNLKRETKFVTYPEYDTSWEMSKDGWGPNTQIVVGTSYKLTENYNVAFEAGYRFAWVESIEQTETTFNGTEKVYKVMDLGPTGVLFLISFGKRL